MFVEWSTTKLLWGHGKNKKKTPPTIQVVSLLLQVVFSSYKCIHCITLQYRLGCEKRDHHSLSGIKFFFFGFQLRIREIGRKSVQKPCGHNCLYRHHREVLVWFTKTNFGRKVFSFVSFFAYFPSLLLFFLCSLLFEVHSLANILFQS